MMSHYLKSIFCCVMFFFLFQEGASAWNMSDTDLHIYYITTTRTVDTFSLIRYLNNEYRSLIRNEGIDAVFYLPESSERQDPLIVHVNQRESNPAGFEKLLQRISDSAYAHDANPDKDIPAIIDFFKNGNDFLNNNGSMAYNRLVFNYIANPDTDLMDGTIPKFVFTFGFQDLSKTRFQLRVLHHRDDEFEYDALKPFGDWDFFSNYIITTYE